MEVARHLGEVRQRKPDLLTARHEEAAHPWSLSGVYGRAAFPWHTDGAVAELPPQYVVMWLREASGCPVPTELSDPLETLSADLLGVARRAALKIKSRGGEVTYRSMIYRAGDLSILRWDPRVCELPSSESHLSAAMNSLRVDVTVSWIPGRLLIFNNWRMMHRRPPVEPEVTRSLLRLYSFK
jgi:alpha-ketoglutarate-dependent taurine dioxygenase